MVLNTTDSTTAVCLELEVARARSVHPPPLMTPGLLSTDCTIAVATSRLSEPSCISVLLCNSHVTERGIGVATRVASQ